MRLFTQIKSYREHVHMSYVQMAIACRILELLQRLRDSWIYRRQIKAPLNPPETSQKYGNGNINGTSQMRLSNRGGIRLSDDEDK